MKILTFTITLFFFLQIFSAQCFAEDEWLGHASIYTYQDNNIISQSMGSYDDFEKVSGQLATAYSKLANDLAPLTDRAFQLVVLFDESGNTAFWIVNANNSQQHLRELANQALQQVELKTINGPLGLAINFNRIGLKEPLSSKPPIPEEWDAIVNKHQRVTATELFQLLLQQAVK